MNRGVEHILLTRFNLPSVGPESIIRAKEGWLRDRIRLFERYCVPTVLAQTEQHFRWLIYFDPASPSWLLDALRRHIDAGVFHPVLRAEVSADDLLSDVRALCGGAPDTLLTTNVDNDDGLAVDFVARVQAATRDVSRTAAVYLSQGLIKAPQGLYLRSDRHNAFCSVVSTGERPVTAWADWHNRLHLHMPTIEVAGPPAWLQVVHGSNVSNRARGRRVSPTAFTGLFPEVLAGVPEPGRRELLRDAAVEGPLRTARDASRAAAKTVALSVLGKDGLTRAKASLQWERT